MSEENHRILRAGVAGWVRRYEGSKANL